MLAFPLEDADDDDRRPRRAPDDRATADESGSAPSTGASRRAAPAGRRRRVPAAGRGPGARRRHAAGLEIATAARARHAARARLRPRDRRRRDGRCARRASSTTRAGSACLAKSDDRPQLAAAELQLRLRGHHPRRPHAAEHEDRRGPRHLRAGRRLLLRPRPAEHRGAVRGDLVRVHHRDDEHRPRVRDRHLHVALRPAGQARQGHRRRRRAGGHAQRAGGGLPGVLRPGHRRAVHRPDQGAPDADRRGRDHRLSARGRGDRREGHDAGAARRCAAACRAATPPSPSAAGWRSRSSPPARRSTCRSR